MTTYLNRQIFDEEEMAEGACEIPANHQVGAAVKLQLREGDDFTIPAQVVAVHITTRHQITYDLAVKIEGFELWAVIKGVRGGVYSTGEQVEPDKGLIDTQKLEQHLESTLGATPAPASTPTLKLAVDNDAANNAAKAMRTPPARADLGPTFHQFTHRLQFVKETDLAKNYTSPNGPDKGDKS